MKRKVKEKTLKGGINDREEDEKKRR